MVPKEREKQVLSIKYSIPEHMSSREKILAAVKANQPEPSALPNVNIPQSEEGLVERFTAIATAIGSKVFEINNIEEIKAIMSAEFVQPVRVVSTLPQLQNMAETDLSSQNPHSFADVDLAILKAEIGVAENSALWLPEANVAQRVLPFIPQHLGLVIAKDALVPTMHQAYDKIGSAEYGYGVFIAGPSKTADIEQSLVLGAHGPRSLMVFLLNS